MTNPLNVLYPATNEAFADRLGEIQAMIADLKAEEAGLKAILLASGEDVVEGDLFRVSMSRDIETTRVDWKAVAAKFEPSRQLVTAHSKVSTSNRVAVKARSTK